jgi:hypothetical protein
VLAAAALVTLLAAPGCSRAPRIGAAERRAWAEACDAVVAAIAHDGSTGGGAAEVLERLRPGFLGRFRSDAASIDVCRAVATDSDGPCDVLPAEARDECRYQRDLYHGARAAPAGRAWRMPPSLMERCVRLTGAPANCAQTRDAVVRGEPGRCPTDWLFTGLCRALASGDPTPCPADGADCRTMSLTWRLLDQGGLARLAAEGPELPRILAGAALGRPGACAPFGPRMVQVCRGALRCAEGTGDSGCGRTSDRGSRARGAWCGAGAPASRR